jgi:hypothetical protein
LTVNLLATNAKLSNREQLEPLTVTQEHEWKNSLAASTADETVLRADSLGISVH